MGVIKGVNWFGVFPGKVKRVRVPLEWFHWLVDEVVGTVSGVGVLSSNLLKTLPDGEDTVGVGVVEEEDWVVGGVFKMRHGVPSIVSTVIHSKHKICIQDTV